MNFDGGVSNLSFLRSCKMKPQCLGTISSLLLSSPHHVVTGKVEHSHDDVSRHGAPRSSFHHVSIAQDVTALVPGSVIPRQAYSIKAVDKARFQLTISKLLARGGLWMSHGTFSIYEALLNYCHLPRTLN